MRSVLFLSILLSSLATADSLLRLAVGNEAACVVGFPGMDSTVQDQKVVRCFDKTGQPLEIPMGENPQDVAVGHRVGGVYGGYVCTAGSGKISCVGAEQQGAKVARAFASFKLTQYHLLSAGMYDICAADRAAGVRCVGGEIPEVRWTKIAESTPNTGPVQELAVGALYACALGVNKQISCWGGVRDVFASLVDAQAKPALAAIHAAITNPPKDLVRPHSLSVGLSQACVIDEGRPRCWGGNLAGEMGAWKVTGAVDSLDAASKRTCAIVAGQLKCQGQKDAAISHFLENDGPEFPLMFATSKDQSQRAISSCLVDPENLICRGRMNFSVKHAVLGFHLYNIENELDRLARHIYIWKAPVLNRAAGLARKLGTVVGDPGVDQGRLFLANAIKSFVSGIQNDYFEKLVAPRFDRVVDYYNRRLQKTGLMDMPKNLLNGRSALYILKECFGVSRDLLSEKGEVEMAKELDSRISAAIAKPRLTAADLTPVMNQLADMKPLTDRLKASPTAIGLMELAKRMVEFLRAY
ncbi:MAG: hypothetical protein HYR96_07930 [Deltaproteobacteria bacterium]|nr:hypothetical protein [Deltaproteobacteria bacterium]MBI3293436.1 hypothetical protein [Deltaproteobacteria bacterium]